MKIDNLREFSVFARYLNFTAAARHLYVTQPALSYRIASMEKELGLTLVDRSDPVRLTPAGKAFLAEAVEILGRYEGAVERCRGLARSAGGKLVIEHPTGMPAASGVFDALLADFVRSHPGADVRCARSDGRRLRNLLLERDVDAGVVFDRAFLDAPADPGAVATCVPGLAAGPAGPVIAAEAEDPSLFVDLPRHPDARVYALLSADDPLVARERLLARDLNGRCLAFQMDPRFAAGRAYFERMLGERGVHVRFAEKTERDDVDFAWSVAPDELVLSDAGAAAMCATGAFSSPSRVARPLEDEGLAVTPRLAYMADNRNPLLAEFVAYVKLASSV